MDVDSSSENARRDLLIKATEERVSSYPIAAECLLEVISSCWSELWKTQVGGVDIKDMGFPSQVIASMFEKILVKRLENRYPTLWKGQETKKDKDIVCIPNDIFSTELKMSGQKGYSIYGNRSYCVGGEVGSSTKSREGYYLAINFLGDKLTMVRLGWLDKEDWIPQKSQTGQSSRVSQEALSCKMMPLVGSYILDTPIINAKGVGAGLVEHLESIGVLTFKDALVFHGECTKALKVKSSVISQLASIKKNGVWMTSSSILGEEIARFDAK